MPHGTGVATDGALEILHRINNLPLIRRRGQPEHHREPIYAKQHPHWHNSGVTDESGELLILAAAAAPTVSRWELETSFLIGRWCGEWWARSTYKGFEETFGNKSHYQLVEVLEAVVHASVDVPAVREILVPDYRRAVLGGFCLVHECRSSSYRMLVEVGTYVRRHVEITVEDYGGTKHVSVCPNEQGMGVTYHSSGRYEHKHVEVIEALLSHLVKNGMLPDDLLENKNFLSLKQHAHPDSEELEK